MEFAKYFYKWYQLYRKEGLRKVTQNKYEDAYKKLVNTKLGKTELKKVNRKIAQEYMDWYGSTRRKATVYDHRAYLKACMSDAVADGDAKINPFGRIQLHYVDQKFSTEKMLELRDQKKTLSFEEYKTFKNYLEFTIRKYLKEEPIRNWNLKVKNERKKNSVKQIHMMIIYVALKTGARFSEIVGLTWKDISFNDQVIKINKTWAYKYTNVTFEKTKNLGSIREIPVDQDFMDLMKLFKKWSWEHIETDENTLFIETKVAMHDSTINKTLEVLLKECGIERLTLHKLRHTQASILLAEGIDEHVVAKRLGHTDTTMIHRVYGHLVKEREDEDNERILKLL